MELPLRMICSACGRSVTWSEDGFIGSPSPCPICGAPIEPGQADDGFRLASTVTPASLQLTPDEVGAEIWANGNQSTPLTKLGRFQIRELIGNGGFGQVYRAFDVRLEREVALKVLRDSRPPARVIERFFREARAAAQLDHTHIVSLFDAGRDEGKCWIAYQFVNGCTLNLYTEKHPRDHRDTARIIRDLADALAHAHDRGVYHRDIKPGNVLIDTSGRARLTDFGLARRIDFEPTMTYDGAVLGTIHYMSPEQASGKSHQADGRSDIYSLGVMFYEMLCGRRPVEAPSHALPWAPSSTAERTKVLSPRSRDRTIPRPLERICLRALATEPDNRFATARLMAEALDRCLEVRPARATRATLVAGIFLAALVTREATAVVTRRWSQPAPVAAISAKKTDIVVADKVSNHVAHAADQASEGEKASVIGNSASKMYHLFADCAALKGMEASHKIPLAGRDEAESKHFRLCGKCSLRAAKTATAGDERH